MTWLVSGPLAVCKALEERQQRLALQIGARPDEERFLAFLKDEIWSQIPAELRGTRLSKEEEEILGYGEMVK